MKAKVLFLGLPIYILSGVLFGQVALTGSAPQMDDIQSVPVNMSSGSTDTTPGNNDGNTDNNNPSNSTNDAHNKQQRIFQGGGHVTVQDILGAFPDEFLHQTSLIGISQTPDTDYNNPVSVNSPVTNPSQNNATATFLQTSISIYPNPTSDQCNVVTEGEIIFGVVEVIDVTGKTVKKVGNLQQTGQGSTVTIPVNDLKPGIYLLRFQTNKDIHVKRLQVK